MGTLIDLSVGIENGMPAHALFPSPIILPYVNHEQAKAAGLGEEGDPFTYAVNYISMLEHVGTHVDAPIHFGPNGEPTGTIENASGLVTKFMPARGVTVVTAPETVPVMDDAVVSLGFCAITDPSARSKRSSSDFSRAPARHRRTGPATSCGDRVRSDAGPAARGASSSTTAPECASTPRRGRWRT